MKQLLRGLNDLGYLLRPDAPNAVRARMIYFTKRGRAASAKAHDVLSDIEREGSAELGAKRFAQLWERLGRVRESPLTR